MPQKITTETLTKMLESDTKLSYMIEPLQDGTIEMRLNNGFRLNDLLPEHMGIRQFDNIMPTIKENEIRLDHEKMSNPYYRAIVAHEFGHNMDEEQDPMWRQAFRMELNMEYNLGVFDSEFGDLSDTEKMAWIMKIYQIRMQREINAWDHGKVVADLLRVDQTTYEEARNTGIQSHYSSELFRAISHIAKQCPDISEQEVIEYFNPFTNNVGQTTWSDLLKLKPQLEELNNRSIEESYQKVGLKKP